MHVWQRKQWYAFTSHYHNKPEIFLFPWIQSDSVTFSMHVGGWEVRNKFFPLNIQYQTPPPFEVQGASHHLTNNAFHLCRIKWKHISYYEVVRASKVALFSFKSSVSVVVSVLLLHSIDDRRVDSSICCNYWMFLLYKMIVVLLCPISWETSLFKMCMYRMRKISLGL